MNYSLNITMGLFRDKNWQILVVFSPASPRIFQLILALYGNWGTLRLGRYATACHKNHQKINTISI